MWSINLSQTASVTYQRVSGQCYYAIVSFYAGNLKGPGGTVKSHSTRAVFDPVTVIVEGNGEALDLSAKQPLKIGLVNL